LNDILDTRFFIAHLVEDDLEIHERTRAHLRELRRRGGGFVPTIVLAEFCDQACRHAGRKPAGAMCDAILASGLEIAPLTVEIARASGLLRCRHRDVPMADCVVAATAAERKGRVISDDPHFAGLGGIRVAWV